MKNCPFCAEEIQDAALKCRFCGEFLNAANTAPLTAKKKPSPHATGSRPMAKKRKSPKQSVLFGMVLVMVIGAALLGAIVWLIAEPDDFEAGAKVNLGPSRIPDRPIPTYRPVPGLCDEYARIVAARAKECPDSMGNLQHLKGQADMCMRNIRRSGPLELEKCRKKVPKMSCRKFANGDFLDVCFP